MRLGREAAATAARGRGIGIIEREPAGVKTVLVVDRGAHQVQPMPAVHEHGDTADLELEVVIALPVESEEVAHAGASTAADAHAECVPLGKLLLVDDGADFGWWPVLLEDSMCEKIMLDDGRVVDLECNVLFTISDHGNITMSEVGGSEIWAIV